MRSPRSAIEHPTFSKCSLKKLVNGVSALPVLVGRNSAVVNA